MPPPGTGLSGQPSTSRRTAAAPGRPASPHWSAYSRARAARWPPPSGIPTWSSSATWTAAARPTAAAPSQRINDWDDYYPSPADKLHADINGLQFVLYHGQETLFLSTDGGTYLSTNGGLNVSNITERPAECAVLQHLEQRHQSGPLPGRLAGSGPAAFDPGAAAGRAGAPLSNGQLISGDYSGLASAIARHDERVRHLSHGMHAPGRSCSSAGRRTPGTRCFVRTLPTMSLAGFFAASAADPDDPATVYVAGDHIWKMRYLGDGEFSQTRLPQNFSPNSRDYVSALAIAPSDHDRLVRHHLRRPPLVLAGSWRHLDRIGHHPGTAADQLERHAAGLDRRSVHLLRGRQRLRQPVRSW